MPRNRHLCLTLPALLLLALACDRPECTNTNPVFDRFPPVSREYRNELARQLETSDHTKLTYWFRELSGTGDRTQLLFDVQGKGLCAVMALEVEQWGKLELLRQKRGASYRGAEFENLTFDIRKDTSGAHFIFRDYRRIVD